ncbi:MAG: Rnf-Nqr domain containing protein [Spirochaetia bacterium]|jgi:electron transport complex protein RnfE
MTSRENLLAMLFLGLCPAIAVSARVIDALWMSAGVVLVLVLSALAASLLSPDSAGDDRGRLTAPWMRALVISSLLTASFEAGLIALAPTASAALGIYAPLIAVNCLVLGRGLPGHTHSSPGGAVAAALGRGIGFAASLVLIALVREVLGAGTITLFPVGRFGGTIEIPMLVEQPVRALGFAGGGLLCLGYFAGAARGISHRTAARSTGAEAP